MKKISSIIIALAIIAATGALAHEFLVPQVGTFTGGSVSITNGVNEVNLGAVFISGTSSNFSVQVVNMTGYTNTIAPATATSELAYMPSLALPWRKDAVLILTTGSTNTAKYVIYKLKR